MNKTASFHPAHLFASARLFIFITSPPGPCMLISVCTLIRDTRVRLSSFEMVPSRTKAKRATNFETGFRKFLFLLKVKSKSQTVQFKTSKTASGAQFCTHFPRHCVHRNCTFFHLLTWQRF